MPPKRARMAENVRMDELPPVPDGDEENLCAILDDDLDEVSEHVYLTSEEDIVECRLTPEHRLLFNATRDEALQAWTDPAAWGDSAIWRVDTGLELCTSPRKSHFAEQRLFSPVI